VLAARRALVRPVTEQWRRTDRHAAHRGWVLDAVLLTGALAGLAELITAGDVTSARSGSLGLLVPGLLGLAAAVIASRLVPVACGLPFAPASRSRALSRAPARAAAAGPVCSSPCGTSPAVPAVPGPPSCSPPRSRWPRS